VSNEAQAESFAAYQDRKLAEIPIEVLRKAIDVLDAEFARSSWEAQIKNLHDNYGPDWVAQVHHTWGQEIRNLLRDAGLKDILLPSGNWDDYYGPIVEIVAGIRLLPEALWQIEPAEKAADVLTRVFRELVERLKRCEGVELQEEQSSLDFKMGTAMWTEDGINREYIPNGCRTATITLRYYDSEFDRLQDKKGEKGET
jgi:hypothetical protein